MSDQDLALFLVEGMLHSEDLITDIVVEYSMAVEQKSYAINDQSTPDPTGAFIGPLADRGEYKWAMKTDMEYYSERESVPPFDLPDGTMLERREIRTVTAYDGSKTRAFTAGPGQGVVVSGKSDYLTELVTTPRNFAAMHSRGRLYAEMLKREVSNLGVSRDAIDGQDCYVVVLEPKSPRHRALKIWLDADRGFRPLRIEVSIGSVLYRRYDNILLREFSGGVWYPISGVLYTYYPPGRPQEGKMIAKYTMQTHRVEVNKGLPESLFTNIFEEGALIRDLDIGVSYSIETEALE